jgi:hypothetical protein
VAADGLGDGLRRIQPLPLGHRRAAVATVAVATASCDQGQHRRAASPASWSTLLREERLIEETTKSSGRTFGNVSARLW